MCRSFIRSSILAIYRASINQVQSFLPPSPDFACLTVVSLLHSISILKLCYNFLLSKNVYTQATLLAKNEVPAVKTSISDGSKGSRFSEGLLYII